MTGTPWLHDDGSFRCFYCETPRKKSGKKNDPDAWHKGLRESHRLMLERELPNGGTWSFTPRYESYLKVDQPLPSEPVAWSVGSDNFATTHTNALPELASTIPGYTDGHLHDFCTIGGYLPFPNGLAQKRPTLEPSRRLNINQAKGWERRVSDRIDLTLEAIRLYYLGVVDRPTNPLGDVLDAYGWFFDRFGTGADGFAAYVDYFFLCPFVSDGRVVPLYGDALVFQHALPRGSVEAYLDYIERQRAAVMERNALITGWWEGR